MLHLHHCKAVMSYDSINFILQNNDFINFILKNKYRLHTDTCVPHFFSAKDQIYVM